MAIFGRIKWNVIERGRIRDVVSFPASYDERTVVRTLIVHYGYTGNFIVKRQEHGSYNK